MSGLLRRPKSPAVPDFAGLAGQQSQLNNQSALDTSKINTPNESNPWGSISRTYDPGSGQWSYNTQLSAPQQQLLGNEQAFDLSATGKARSVLDSLPTGGVDTSGFADRVSNVTAGTDRDALTDALYQRNTRLMDPQWQRQEDATLTRLLNQGITQGSEAYNNAMSDFGNARESAYSGARLDAIAGAGAEMDRDFGRGLTNAQLANAVRDSQFGEALTQRSLPYSDLAAIMGQYGGVQTPQFGGAVSQAQYSAPNIYGAATDTFSAQQQQYQQKLDQQRALWNTISNIAGRAASGGMGGGG